MTRFAGPLTFGILIGALLGAAAMGLIQFDSVGDPTAPPVQAASRAPERDASSTPSAAPATVDSTPASIRETEVVGGTTEAPAGVLERLSRAVLDSPARPRHHGTKSIRGRVADRDGNGLAGVVVRATHRGEEGGAGWGEDWGEEVELGDGAPPPSTLEKAVHDAVRGWYATAVDEREATTDAEGCFELAELADGDWWLEAWCVGFDIEGSDQPSMVEAGGSLDFVATPVVRIEVVVLLPDGSIAPAATVSTRRADHERRGSSTSWTPGSPRIALLPGEWSLEAKVDERGEDSAASEPLVSDAERVTILAGIDAPPVTLRLHGAPGIRGTVRISGTPADDTPDAEIPGGFRVKLLPLAAGVQPDLTLLAESDSDLESWHSQSFSFSGHRRGDELSSYRFDDLAAGRYAVGVTRSWGGRIFDHAVVEVVDRMVVQDFEIPPLDPSARLTVRVLDPDGNLDDSAQLQVEVETPGHHSWRSMDAERQAVGVFAIPLESIEDPSDLTRPWPAGTKVTLTANSDRWGEAAAELSSSTRSIDLRFAPPARLIVVVEGFAGSGLQGRLSLDLEPVADVEDSGIFPFGSSGENVRVDGTTAFDPRAPGLHRLSLIVRPPDGDHWGATRVASVDVALAPGENHARIAIPPLHSLTMELEDGAGASMWLNEARGNASHSHGTYHRLDAEGRTTFRDLPAGDYVVQCDRGGGATAMRVSVPSPGPVRFVPSARNALIAWIADESGTLALAGLRNRDLVIGLDGREFDATADAPAALAAARDRGRLTLLVLRDGSRLDLEVAAALFEDPFAMGGSLHPTAR